MKQKLQTLTIIILAALLVNSFLYAGEESAESITGEYGAEGIFGMGILQELPADVSGGDARPEGGSQGGDQQGSASQAGSESQGSESQAGSGLQGSVSGNDARPGSGSQSGDSPENDSQGSESQEDSASQGSVSGNDARPEGGSQGGSSPENDSQGSDSQESGSQGSVSGSDARPEGGSQGGGSQESGSQGSDSQESGSQGSVSGGDARPEGGSQSGGSPENDSQGNGSQGNDSQEDNASQDSVSDSDFLPGERLEEGASGKEGIVRNNAAIFSVTVPKSMDFVLDPYELSGQGSVWSQEYRFVNQGNTPVRLFLKDLHCTAAEDVRIVEDPESVEGRDKRAMLRLSMRDGEVLEITEKASAYERILEPGEELVFQIKGKISASDRWRGEDIRLSMRYQIEVIAVKE